MKLYINTSKKQRELVDVEVSKTTFLHTCFLFHIFKRSPHMTTACSNISLNKECLPKVLGSSEGKVCVYVCVWGQGWPSLVSSRWKLQIIN